MCHVTAPSRACFDVLVGFVFFTNNQYIPLWLATFCCLCVYYFSWSLFFLSSRDNQNGAQSSLSSFIVFLGNSLEELAGIQIKQLARRANTHTKDPWRTRTLVVSRLFQKRIGSGWRSILHFSCQFFPLLFSLLYGITLHCGLSHLPHVFASTIIP